MKKVIATMAMVGFLASVGAASAADKPEGTKEKKTSLTAKAAETKPAETKPAETKPAETKPAKEKKKAPKTDTGY